MKEKDAQKESDNHKGERIKKKQIGRKRRPYKKIKKENIIKKE